jgi:protease-4
MEIEKDVVDALLEEQRKTRIFRWFFGTFAVMYILFLTMAMFHLFSDKSYDSSTNEKHTAVIKLDGVIQDKAYTSADNVIASLRRAMYDPMTKGIILRCNSPGGAPVQSDYIYREIRRLRSSNPGIPVHTVISDMCASGGYYIASATDKIYVNPSSIVGSIGVINDGFGFTKLMKKLGVERRILTSGKNKSMLDPFSESKKSHVKHTKEIMSEIHREFINAVVVGRGDRLQSHHKDIFSGLYWTGRKAIKLGLADGIGDVYTVSANDIGANLLVDFTPRETDMNRFIKNLSSEVKVMFSSLSSYIFSL